VLFHLTADRRLPLQTAEQSNSEVHGKCTASELLLSCRR
jgi:hypothetical protein